MHNFKTYLEEGRDAPLYHATQTHSLVEILKTQMLDDITYQTIDKKRVSGVSLTRDYNFALGWVSKRSFEISTAGVIEFNQRALSQKHKIVPYNFGLYDITRKMGKGSEYEEFVYGKIKNINKYIVKIHMSAEIMYYPEFKSIIAHPKLFINGKFINA